MMGEPASGVLHNRFEGARFFKKVRGARYNNEFLFAGQLVECGAIERQHLDIIAADDQQRRSFH